MWLKLCDAANAAVYMYLKAPSLDLPLFPKPRLQRDSKCDCYHPRAARFVNEMIIFFFVLDQFLLIVLQQYTGMMNI